ncbi:MAG: GTPase Era [Rickettsiales bacterium]|jgi:GTP-binding protein Era|nr:GTPase Era [Rickettsiales bacterium]
MTKILSVALAGAPNAGKSTLVNYLVGEKISIISPKVQTTRDLIRGVFIENDTEIIMIDTPGVFIPKKARLLERKIVKTAWSGIRSADLICVLLDGSEKFADKVKIIFDEITRKEMKAIVVINKVDAVKKPKLLDLTNEITKYFPTYNEIFYISARTGFGIDKLKEYIVKQAVEGNWVFKEDEITDVPLKFLTTEITREKLFLKLEQELPYNIDVETEKWEEFKNGDVRIQQLIYVTKDSYKSMILGKHGQTLKEIGIDARLEMEKFLDRKVHLFLFVKLKEKWIEEKFSGM